MAYGFLPGYKISKHHFTKVAMYMPWWVHNRLYFNGIHMRPC